MPINVNKPPRPAIKRFEAILILLIFILFAVAVWGFRNITAFIQTSQPATVNGDKPNVILINIDSLRADHMGIYGYQKNTTPFLDSLFAKGVIFENAITPGILTFQTDASIFASVYPSQHNAIKWERPIKDNLYYLPKILSWYGYKTAAFVSPSLWKQFGFDKIFDDYKLNLSIKNVPEAKIDVAKWISRQNQPFFVFWHIYDAHLPYLEPTEEFYNKKYTGSLSRPDIVWIWEKQKPGVFWYKFKKAYRDPSAPSYSYLLTQTDREYLAASYDSGIRYVDNQLNAFFDLIKDEPSFKNTIVIISSEHGDDLGEHGFFFHRDLYDVNIRVPLAIIYPQLKPQRVKQVVSSLDIMPTVLSFVKGVPKAENIEGKDLTPLTKGKTSDREIFIERPPFDEYSVRTDKWKYIWRNPDKKKVDYKDSASENFMKSIVDGDTTFTDELYDLENDPGEQTNLVGKRLPQETQLKTEVLNFRNKMREARRQNENIGDIVGHRIFSYP